MTTFPSALLYSIGLHGSFAQGVVNPARWDPANATTMRGSGTTRLLAVDSQSGPRRAVVATFGTVLQSNIVESTPSYHGSTQQVLQVILAPFDYEWTRITQFYGAVFNKSHFSISIYGPKILGQRDQDRMHGLQIRSWPSEDTSAPQAVGTYLCCILHSIF